MHIKFGLIYIQKIKSAFDSSRSIRVQRTTNLSGISHAIYLLSCLLLIEEKVSCAKVWRAWNEKSSEYKINPTGSEMIVSNKSTLPFIKQEYVGRDGSTFCEENTNHGKLSKVFGRILYKTCTVVQQRNALPNVQPHRFLVQLLFEYICRLWQTPINTPHYYGYRLCMTLAWTINLQLNIYRTRVSRWAIKSMTVLMYTVNNHM